MSHGSSKDVLLVLAAITAVAAMLQAIPAWLPYLRRPSRPPSEPHVTEESQPAAGKRQGRVDRSISLIIAGFAISAATALVYGRFYTTIGLYLPVLAGLTVQFLRLPNPTPRISIVIYVIYTAFILGTVPATMLSLAVGSAVVENARESAETERISVQSERANERALEQLRKVALESEKQIGNLTNLLGKVVDKLWPEAAPVRHSTPGPTPSVR